MTLKGNNLIGEGREEKRREGSKDKELAAIRNETDRTVQKLVLCNAFAGPRRAKTVRINASN